MIIHRSQYNVEIKPGEGEGVQVLRVNKKAVEELLQANTVQAEGKFISSHHNPVLEQVPSATQRELAYSESATKASTRGGLDSEGRLPSTLKEQMGTTAQASSWKSRLGVSTASDSGRPLITAVANSEKLATPEEKIRVDYFLNPDTIDQSLSGLSENQQAMVLKSIMADLEKRLKQFRRRKGQFHKVSRCKDILERVEGRYRALQAQSGSSKVVRTHRRPRNRFTKVSYATLKEEIEGVKKWKKAEMRTLHKIHEQYARAKKQLGARRWSESCDTLRRQLNTSSLKLWTVKKHIQMLVDEATSEAQLGQVNNSQIKEAKMSSPEHGKELFSLEPICVPYDVHHNVLGNIIDQFKEVMHRFGRREFPNIMKSRDWSSPESIPVTEFMSVMAEDPDNLDRYRFFEKEFKSLRHIRNAHAHSLGNITLGETRALLDDVQTVADALLFTNHKFQTHQYQLLLASFERKCRDVRTTHQSKVRERWQKLELERETAIRKLDHGTTNTQDQLEVLDAQKIAINRAFDSKLDTLRHYWETLKLDIAISVSKDLAAFASEERIRRSLRSMVTPAATDLIQRLYAEYHSGATMSAISTSTAVQAPGADPTPSTPDSSPSVPSSNTASRGSHIPRSLASNDAAGRTEDLPQPPTSKFSQPDSKKENVDLSPRGRRSSVTARDSKAISSSKNTKSRDTRQTTTTRGGEEAHDIEVDPSFSFLFQDDEMFHAQDMTLEKPRDTKQPSASISVEETHDIEIDPSFSFLFQDGEMFHAHDMTLDKPFTPLSDTKSTYNPAITFESTPNVAEQDEREPLIPPALEVCQKTPMSFYPALYVANEANPESPSPPAPAKEKYSPPIFFYPSNEERIVRRRIPSSRKSARKYKVVVVRGRVKMLVFSYPLGAEKVGLGDAQMESEPVSGLQPVPASEAASERVSGLESEPALGPAAEPACIGI